MFVEILPLISIKCQTHWGEQQLLRMLGSTGKIGLPLPSLAVYEMGDRIANLVILYYVPLGPGAQVSKIILYRYEEAKI